jgi:hypothetical protein
MSTVINETTETFTDIEFAFNYRSVGVAFTLEGTPDEVYKELIRLGLDEDTNYTTEMSINTRTSNLLLVFPSEKGLDPEAGWLAYLRGEESTSTRISVLTEKLAAAKGIYTTKLRQVIRDYACNSTELEQLVAVASIDDAVFLRTLARNTEFESIKVAVKNRLRK